ncbi:MAG TPA: polysaccharide deacetylase family protein [Polyangia bacterium]|nr:polysaccharide deacetylase family protein [Polyangia bacterium]
MPAGPPTIALMYHAIGEGAAADADPRYTVPRERFARQLGRCARLGGAVVSARDWLAGRAGVIFTFDDGDETNHRVAWPLLATAGATADFFVNPAQVGTPGYATWAELREMADGGMSIQSHGLDHRVFLTELAPRRLREDLRRARLEIEERVGRPVTLLAPAGGREPANLVEVALEVGYARVMNSKPRRVWPDDGPTLGRIAATARLDDATLESWLRGGPALLAAEARYAVLAVAKRVLGDDVYQRVRLRLLGA